MSISAAHFNEVTNGYEKQSDGLWVHKGKLSVGSPGTSGTGLAGDLSVNRGSNMGAIYFGGMGAAQYIYWNGTAWQFQPGLTGAAIADGSIGTADLADGAVTTPKLAAGAAQVLIGSYFAAPTWSTTAVSIWTATLITTGSIACSGALCRIEANCVLSHSVASGSYWVGVMIDGAVPYVMSAGYNAGPVGVADRHAWLLYYTPSATNHTFTVAVYNHTVGTLALNAPVQAALFVTEQKR